MSATQQQQEFCPDPSVHDHAAKLQDQASRAALYVTHPEDKIVSPASTIPALGPDGKLSAAGAAASLKYAKPHELPSFPSVGIDTASSGNKAANLANSSHKEFEHWKPELSSSAGKAALLAHRDGGKLNLWQPSASDTGLSAAGLALKTNSSPQLDYGYTDEGRRRALLAATQSLKPKQAVAQPLPKYPDAANFAANALNAASTAHRPTIEYDNSAPMSDPALEASRITHLTNVPREMFGDHPPIQLDAEEKRRQDALTAATRTNKKQIEDAQKLVLEQRAAKAALDKEVRNQAKNYLTLQSEAQKLAGERLSKLDPDAATAYREHYGVNQAAPKRMISLRRKGTEKSKDQDDGDEDEEDDAARAGRIRHQMRKLDSEVQSADEKKRQEDREKLRAAAEKSVKARMATLDEQVFMETGKYSPAMMEEWERQARVKANANVEERMKHYGKVHIGGGKYMDQNEIDAIAQGRMQPTLDEIAESAEKQRARDEEIRLDQEQRKQLVANEKQREKEEKDEQKRAKDEEKAKAKAEKDAEKARKAEEKEKVKDQKRLEKEETKRLKEQRKAQDAAFAEEQKRAKEASQPDVTTEGAAVAGASTEAEDPVKDITSAGTDAAQNKESAEDPPGVPTTFAEGAAETKAAEVKAVEPEAVEPKVETPEPAAVSEDISRQDTTASKRSSRIGGLFGKFKRTSRQPGSISSLETSSTKKISTETAPTVQPAAAVATAAAVVSAPVVATTETTEPKGKERAVASSPSPDISPIDDQEAKPAPSEQLTAVVQDLTKPSIKDRFSGIFGGRKARDSTDEDTFEEAKEKLEAEDAAEVKAPATAPEPLAAETLTAPAVETKRTGAHSPAPELKNDEVLKLQDA